MSSLAQEESRSISENVRLDIKKCFDDGKVFMPYQHFLGYDKSPDGRPQVDPEHAKLVHRIYLRYLAGTFMHHIALTLTDEGIPAPESRGKKWHATTIKSILSNEKYRGDALL